VCVLVLIMFRLEIIPRPPSFHNRLHSQEAAVAGMTGDKKRKLAPKASASKKQKHWHPVTIGSGVIQIAGGQNKHAFPASTMQVVGEDNITHVFVNLDKNAAWFLKGTGGWKTRKGDLKSVKVICDIRALFNGEEEVASAPSQMDDTDDPMDCMETLKGKKVKKTKTNVAGMCSEAAPDANLS